MSGDFQEWQLGVEFSVPIGFRQAMAAVHHAELQIAKATAVLREQERFVLLELSNAVAEANRAYEVSQTAMNRVLASKKPCRLSRSAPKTTSKRVVDSLLDAQRRLADAHSRFYRVRAEYAVALKNVEYEKGSILDRYDIFVIQSNAPAQNVPQQLMRSTPAESVPPVPPSEDNRAGRSKLTPNVAQKPALPSPASKPAPEAWSDTTPAKPVSESKPTPESEAQGLSLDAWSNTAPKKSVSEPVAIPESPPQQGTLDDWSQTARPNRFSTLP